MKRYLITALLTFASLPTFASNNNQSAISVPSQPSGQAIQPAKVAPPKPFGLESITLEQESKIRQIQVELQTKTQALSPSKEKVAKEVEQWTKVVQNEKFDEEKVKQTLRQYNEKQLDVQVMKIKAEHDMYQILTPEQKNTLEERRQKQKEQMKLIMEKAQEKVNAQNK
ncbi:Spy/CpxP family protein refolding chaperone [Vibrio hepatarius]|uniref:Spy/CpxP family protein refolding chaperone n=1 Tax=Vibrio hepatarius TaxID=171383 RepID=UPI001C08088E|nr:Spy/CpxP family protein refolding chaperone [Vibrio hepatarius]MBU2895554.1 Spy/CpxP family protein refolding chaperone [Vibrio hepatarius]